MSITVIVNQFYRTAGGRLFVAEGPKALAAATVGMGFTVTKDLLIQTDGQGGEVRKERVGVQSQPSAGLVGVWRYRHYAGAVAFERYTDDGRFLFRLPMTSHQGCYRATGGSLSIATTEVNSTMRYSFGGGKLMLTGTEGKSYTYRRAEPWYPRDQVDYQPPKTDQGRPGV